MEDGVEDAGGDQTRERHPTEEMSETPQRQAANFLRVRVQRDVGSPSGRKGRSLGGRESGGGRGKEVWRMGVRRRCAERRRGRGSGRRGRAPEDGLLNWRDVGRGRGSGRDRMQLLVDNRV